MSGSLEPVRCNACVHISDLGLYYLMQKSFTGMGSESMLTPKENSPLPEDRRRDKPATLHRAGQGAQQTTD